MSAKRNKNRKFFQPVIGSKPWLAPNDPGQPMELARECLAGMRKSHLAFSANLVVDIGGTCIYRQSVSVGSGSDRTIGEIVDLGQGNTACQIYAVGALFGSGAIQLQVQTSDALTSGSFTDPTSGLAQMPGYITSGGQFYVNSGIGYASGNPQLPTGIGSGAPLFCSGGIAFTYFQRPHRYARLIYQSGPYPNPIAAGFITNERTTGSGGGATMSPSSGAVSV